MPRSVSSRSTHGYTLIEVLAAASLLGIGAASIEKGAAAELTLFNRNESYVFSREQIRSRSINSAVVGMQLSGKVIGIINKGKLFLN